MTRPQMPEDILPPLDPEEAELLRSFEAGEWQPVPQMAQDMARSVAAARATLAAQRGDTKEAPPVRCSGSSAAPSSCVRALPGGQTDGGERARRDRDEDTEP